MFYQSLHPNCQHQVIYAKFNLQIYYPSQYYRKAWHYKDANIERISYYPLHMKSFNHLMKDLKLGASS